MSDALSSLSAPLTYTNAARGWAALRPLERLGDPIVTPIAEQSCTPIGQTSAVQLKPRSSAVFRGKPTGPLYPGERVAIAGGLLRRLWALTLDRGEFTTGAKRRAAAAVMIDLAGAGRRASAREVATLATYRLGREVSERTVWRALADLRGLGYWIAEPFERDGEPSGHLVRGRRIWCLHYPASRFLARVSRALLRGLSYPGSKGEASLKSERAEPVDAGPCLCQTASEPSPDGHERGTQGGERPIAELAREWLSRHRRPRYPHTS